MSDDTSTRTAGPSTFDEDRLALSRAALARGWEWLLALGVLWLVIGTLAIVLPLAAALALDIALGVMFIVGGALQVAQAFRCRGWRSVVPHALGGLLALAAGILLLFFPLAGILSLTLILGALFLAGGVFQIVTAAQNRHLRGWGWLLVSGLAGIVLGVLIWIGWPATAAWVLGLMVGLWLIFDGWSMILMALSARKQSTAAPPAPPATSTAAPA